MGPEQSVESDSSLLSKVNKREFPATNYLRMEGKQVEEFNANGDDGNDMVRSTLVHMPYNGIWSVTMPVGRGPSPRTGHFCCYSEEMHTAFIGYGAKKSGKLLNDVWALDTEDFTWRKLKLVGNQMEPRTGAAAQMMGNFIVVFGGYSEPHYFADLHTIDVTTGEILRAETKGVQPSPRAEPVFSIYNQKLYLWGGYNGQFPSELHVLDFSKMRWSVFNTGVSGRLGAPFATYDHRIFVYGGSETAGLCVVDMENNTVAINPTTGAPPKSVTEYGGMVRVGQYLFFFGGRSKAKFSLMYACDIEKMWWFVFFIAPDGETTSVIDGKISEDGIFLLPRFNSFSTIYVPEKREIVAFLGHPHKSPTPLFIVDIGEALAILHTREDMAAMFKAGTW